MWFEINLFFLIFENAVGMIFCSIIFRKGFFSKKELTYDWLIGNIIKMEIRIN